MAQPDPHATSGQGGGQTDVARREGAEVAEDAKQQAKATADTAQQEMGRVADEAKRQARDLTEDAKQQLHQQARQQTDNLGGALGQFGDRLHALADGRGEDAGPVRDYADRLAGQVDDAAQRVQSLGFDGMMDEVQRFARRRPGAFLGGALLAGFAVSRLARGMSDADDGPQSKRSQRTPEIEAQGRTAGSPTTPGRTAGSPTTSAGPTATSSELTAPSAPPPPPAPAHGGGMGTERPPISDRPDPFSSGRGRP